MPYLISFLEGVITFISPCLLPMLPIYISYFAGGGERNIKRSLTGALGFVAGFTIVFVALGALAGTAGSFLLKYRTAVNIVSGFIVICFGLNYLGIFRLNIFKGSRRRMDMQNMGFLFGRLDALRRSFSGLGADPRLSAGPCSPGYADAVHLLHGTWTAFHTQRPAY